MLCLSAYCSRVVAEWAENLTHDPSQTQNNLFPWKTVGSLAEFQILPEPEREELMSEFQTVAKTDQIPEGEGRSFPVNGTMVGVFRHQGEFFAINDFCPHQGASLSGSPVAEDGSVMCPWHAWCFSIKDGSWLDTPGSKLKAACYPVRIEGENIQVSVPMPEENSPE